MIDSGLGFQLVPWSREIEKKLGQHVAGVTRGGGGIEWTLGRNETGRSSVVSTRLIIRRTLAMSATKILWGQITVVSLIVLLTIWGATEWTAWRLGFSRNSAGPGSNRRDAGLLSAGFFWWWYIYDAYAPQVFVEGAT
jgi:hypothetical protein